VNYITSDYFLRNNVENLSQVLLRARAEAPEHEIVHLLFSGRPDLPITYSKLVGRSRLFATALENAGIKNDEVVILILQHGEDLILAFFGAILSGAIPSIMPFQTEKLQPDHYRSSLQALFAITRPAAIITYAGFLHDAQIVSAGTSVRVILVAEEISASAASQDEIASGSLEQLKGLARPASSLALLQHSSGTTGLQKGVALSHQSIFNQLVSYSQALQLNTTDVIVSWLPLYHDMGLIAGFLLPILLRIPLVLISPFDWVRAPYRLLQAIHRFRGTLCWLPNFAYNFCAQKIRDAELANLDLSSLRAVINCSEPMHWKSHALFAERFKPYGLQEKALATSYAMAENVFAVTQGGIDKEINIDPIDPQALFSAQQAVPLSQHAGANTGGANPGMKMLSAGRPINGTSIRILNAEGRPVPERTIGEIALQSNCLLTGYYNRPDLTESSFRAGWYLTGDLGYMANEELYVTGRKKDLIIVGGKNIYPQDLEDLASEVKGVHPGRVAAFGVFNEETGTEEVVLVAEVDQPGSETDPKSDKQQKLAFERIANELRQRVTRGTDVALRHVYLVGRNWLIKTSSGKVARSANKAKYLAEVNR
jgi:fatty-acyl-CoA synthase